MEKKTCSINTTLQINKICLTNIILLIVILRQLSSRLFSYSSTNYLPVGNCISKPEYENKVICHYDLVGNDPPKTEFRVCGIYPNTEQQKQGNHMNLPATNYIDKAQLIKKKNPFT